LRHPWRLILLAALLVVTANITVPEVQAGLSYAPPASYYRIDNGGGTVIDTNDDAASGAGAPCTLRDAIAAANASAGPGLHADGCTVTAVGGAPGTNYVIFLPTGGYTYTLNGSELMTTANDIWIVGNTPANAIIQASAAPNTATYRVLLNSGANVELDSLTIRHGRCVGACAGAGSSGGGIHNEVGSTTVDASTASANTAGNGGGIYNLNILNVQNGSLIGGAGAANTATFDGGGIYNQGPLNVQNGSAIGGAGAANTATLDGGGIYNGSGGTMMVTGSRILYNTASGNGGGVYSDSFGAGAADVQGSCIVGNSANSFHNAQAAQQTATGNWRGAAAGPDTPCADTTGGNVDTSGFLAAPILGCPTSCADLQVNKANDTGGNSTVGTAFN
jgi:hypothetical protein